MCFRMERDEHRRRPLAAPMMGAYRWGIALGAANLIAMSIAAIVKAADYSSIWCTLAAFLSLIVFGHLVSERMNERKQSEPQLV